MTTQTTTIVEPDEELRELAFEDVRFPPIELRRSSNPRDARFDLSAIRTRLIPGASWFCFYRTPWFEARRAIFEHGHFPYRLPDDDHDGSWKSANGVLLWPTPNLSARVDPSRPERVYMLEPDDGRCSTILTFRERVLRLYVRDKV